MDEILRNTASTIAVTFLVDGAATDPSPDSATVQIVRDDGTVLVTAGTAATNAGTGRFTYALTPTQTASLDVLTVKWTATLSAQVQVIETYVEIVGGFLCALSDVQASTPNSTETADQLADARTWAETALEDACGCAFRARYARETLSGDGSTSLLLNRSPVQSVTAISAEGTAFTATELADVEAAPSGLLYRGASWAWGSQNYVVSYVHGHRYVPARVSQAAVRLARHYLLPDPSNIDERASSITTEDATYSLVTAGVRGAPFSIPEVNQVVQEYGRAGVGVG